jgi:hypothetical protein
MWSLWNSRNDRRHGKSPIEPRLVVEWALEACFHLSAGSQTPEDERRTTQQDERWQKPDDGFLKVNIDGAFVQDSCEGVVGAVVRGSSGQLRVASARRLSSVGSALLAEAEALRGEVCLIPAGTQDNIVAETDCQVLVSLWKNRGIYRSKIATILNEVEELVASFTSFTLVHTR